MDFDKVFTAFRNCISEPKCKDCPWEQCEQFNQKKVTIPVTLALDVLNMLKEQEAKNVVNMTLSKDCFLIASCPKCNALLTRVEHKNYCGYCGQAVKWE